MLFGMSIRVGEAVLLVLPAMYTLFASVTRNVDTNKTI
ncbi:MAG: hypothetical protein ACI9WS_002986 [Paraglaciecola psychrophila]|jgi:hypothetical protein